MKKCKIIIIIINFVLLILTSLFMACTTVKVDALSIQGDKVVLINQTITLEILVEPEDVDLSSLKWKSSNANIASVSDGVVTGLKPGTVTISASLGDKKATHQVEVVEAMPEREVLNSPAIITPNPKANEKVELALYEKVDGYINENYNPYDYNQISVTATLTSPTNKTITAPAFWYRDYEIKLGPQLFDGQGVSGTASTSKDEPQGMETVSWNGSYHYRIRFTPSEEGNWSYVINVQINGSLVQTLDGDISISSGEDTKGIIQIDESTNRNFTYADGTTFIPIGLNMCWWTNSNRKTYDYDVWFGKFSENGGNMVRIWMATWGFSLHWGKYYNNFDDRQASAARLDRVLGLAEDNDIYVQLALVNHGQFSSKVNPLWNDNPYNVENGGILTSPEQFFSDSDAKTTFKNELLYLIGRYGYCENLMAWELFNEVDWTDNADINSMAIRTWHKEMAQFIEANDSYNHLITTSYKSTSGVSFRLTEIDYVNPHDYGYTGKNVNSSLPQSQESIYKNYKKPVLSSEIGINWQSGHDTLKDDQNGASIRQALFAGFMGGGAGGAMQWWWDSWIHPGNLYYQFKGAAAYASKLNLSGSDYSQLRLNNEVTLSNSEAGILGYKFDNRVYGYLYNTKWYYSSTEVSDIDTQVTIPFANGTYKLSVYNTLTGEQLLENNITVSEGKVTLTIPTFNEDIAFILE